MVAMLTNNETNAKSGPVAYAIETRSLSKTFGDVQAVKSLDLKIKKGQIYALLGPNGAGKTTTINLLTTLSRPTGGEAKVAGFDIEREADAVRHRIAVTFQETVLDKNLPGRNLLEIHGRLYRMPKDVIKARSEELVKMVELQDFIHRPVRVYSGGMKRRLEIARSLMTDPEVLFLDEPTVGLDPQNRSNIWSFIQKLNREKGLTILLTTHYMEEAEKLADRVGIIDRGEIIVEGTPAELIGAMGENMVSLTGKGPDEQLCQKLQAQSWVSYALSQAPEEGSAAETEGAVVLRIGLKKEPGPLLKPILDLAADQGFAVADIKIQQPDLNDVFLKYTGRRLRD